MTESLWRADLHSHSTCSDGVLSVPELIDLAKKNGLNGLAITDHDTIQAHLSFPTPQDFYLLAGIEFSTTFEGHSIHMLGYSYNLNSPEMAELCQRHQLRREERNEKILEKLKTKGIFITTDDLLEFASQDFQRTIGRPHIATAMVKKGYVATLNDAFKLYLSDNSSCFVKGETITTEETLEVLRKAGAYAVLAHPHLVPNSNLVEKILRLKLDGIEAYYAYFAAAQHTRWLKMAEKYNLFVTGGSDFHGGEKVANVLGCSWTKKETFEMLWNRYKENNPQLSLPALP
ncbi:MAG: PHP domain-containing protein [Parachlamydiales bacterium]|jgi:hypothetical protein